jgi:hypothetical protein
LGADLVMNVRAPSADERKAMKSGSVLVGMLNPFDAENNAAMAKAEIVIPNWRIFTDYFLLMKYEGSWKIVQKSYTWREIPAAEKK